MSEKKLGPSDFQAEVERLREAGKLPALDEVLDAVADARRKFAAKIREARRSPDLDQEREAAGLNRPRLARVTLGHPTGEQHD